MSGTTITRSLGAQIALQGLFTKDANGVACQGISYSLVIVSGPANGITLLNQLGNYVLKCTIEGTYQIQIQATNSGGSLSTDAAGDSGVSDTINIVVPPPASQGWNYV
jgi:hypothetical protein